MYFYWKEIFSVIHNTKQYISFDLVHWHHLTAQDNFFSLILLNFLTNAMKSGTT